MFRRTAFFAVVYVFVMEVGSRRIVHFNVTANPTPPWVEQQIREATAWGQTPRFLAHDSHGIFGQFGRRVTVEENDRKSRYRWHPPLIVVEPDPFPAVSFLHDLVLGAETLDDHYRGPKLRLG